MLLAIDISNTSIKFGVFVGRQLLADWRIATERHRLADEYAMLLLNLFEVRGVHPPDIKMVAISCVVPPLRSVFDELSRKYLHVEPIQIGPKTAPGIVLNVDYPEEVGADRIVNVAATQELYGGPAIAVAFGTATVFDCISKQGEYLGGAIAPGMAVALESLTRSAAQLYQVELTPPPHAIGTNTIHTLQSGLVLGFAGLVEGLVRRLKKEMIGRGEEDNIKVVATGGLAEIVAPQTDAIQVVDPYLTLNGLRILADRLHLTSKAVH